MEDKTLIEIKVSDRYDKGDMGFISDFNMAYVQQYVEVIGEAKEDYINRKEKQYRDYWEADLAQCFSKYQESLKRASKYIDVSKYKIKY